jgi:lipopolysaccharide/colanic/teichoic acid biosynthesis glycosyltransferase
LSWEEKFALDVRYVDHWSMALDWKILAATLWKVLTRHGISHEEHPTAPRFEGNKADR